jgi:hypothetical protein
MSARRAKSGRFRKATLDHLHTEVCRLAEDFSLRLIDTIAKSPVSEIPMPPRRRRRTNSLN